MRNIRYGSWLVLDEADKDRHGNRRWRCRCDCGAVSVVYQNSLRGGNSTQCGLCSRRSTVKVRAKSLRTHGQSRTSTYRSWEAMVRRCTRPNSTNFHLYGGRGVQVCSQWIGPGGFEQFFECLGEKPSSEHSLDRIDNNGNYEPGNVRWARAKQQQNNRRSNRQITYNGKTLTLQQWSGRVGIKRETIAYRLNHGWSTAQSLGFEDHPRANVRGIGV